MLNISPDATNFKQQNKNIANILFIFSEFFRQTAFSSSNQVLILLVIPVCHYEFWLYLKEDQLIYDIKTSGVQNLIEGVMQ